MSSLPDHQSDGEPRGFPGHVLTSVACLPRRIRLRGGAPAPSPVCSGAGRMSCAAYGQSGECAISICSRSLDCFPVTTTASAGGPESSCRLPAEMSSVQALMDLALPRFAGQADGPRQVHPPWSVASDSPASPAPTQLDPTSRCSMDQMSVSSTYLNLDALSSSSEEESRDKVKRSDLSVTLLCSSSEEAGTCVNSDEAC